MDMKNRIEVKKLVTEPARQGFTGWIKSKQVIKTTIGVAIGAVGGLFYTYFSNDFSLDAIPQGDIFQNVIFGVFFGIFFTNNPCARNKC